MLENSPAEETDRCEDRALTGGTVHEQGRQEMGVQGRLQSDVWAGRGWLCKVSLGAGNGWWSEVGQGEKNVLCRDDRASKHIKYQHV